MQKLFIGGMLTVGLALLLLAGYSYLKPRPPERNVALEATNLLRSVKATPLSQGLQHYIETGDGFFVETAAHPLLGKKAPSFSLPNHRTDPVALNGLLKRGPVVLVFYLGYTCDHCVAQLFGLNEDLKYFDELGVTVVAVSPDSPDKTTERFKRYGAFQFPVLADYKNRVAAQFGVYQPETASEQEMLFHATFVIDANGIVRWAKLGETPFYHNPTLLREIAKLKGAAPSVKRS